jgi:prevent-host-death family protein
MTYVLPVTQARKDFLHLVDRIDEDYTRVDLTKNGKVKATLVSPKYLDELEETIYSLTHSMRDIRQAEQEIAKGKYVTLEEFLRNYHASKNTRSSSKSTKKRS